MINSLFLFFITKSFRVRYIVSLLFSSKFLTSNSDIEILNKLFNFRIEFNTCKSTLHKIISQSTCSKRYCILFCILFIVSKSILILGWASLTTAKFFFGSKLTPVSSSKLRILIFLKF